MAFIDGISFAHWGSVVGYPVTLPQWLTWFDYRRIKLFLHVTLLKIASIVSGGYISKQVKFDAPVLWVSQRIYCHFIWFDFIGLRDFGKLEGWWIPMGSGSGAQS
jgi:hypothetical protein